MANARLRVAAQRSVRERAANRCEYCLSPQSHIPDRLSIEHITPRVAGGSDALDNLALSCQRCNNLKASFTEATDPETRERVPLYHPRRDRRTEHFMWSDNGLLMLGLTPTGRATIERLQLNREGVVNLRRLLAGVGGHPPAP